MFKYLAVAAVVFHVTPLLAVEIPIQNHMDRAFELWSWPEAANAWTKPALIVGREDTSYLPLPYDGRYYLLMLFGRQSIRIGWKDLHKELSENHKLVIERKYWTQTVVEYAYETRQGRRCQVPIYRTRVREVIMVRFEDQRKDQTGQLPQQEWHFEVDPACDPCSCRRW